MLKKIIIVCGSLILISIMFSMCAIGISNIPDNTTTEIPDNTTTEIKKPIKTIKVSSKQLTKDYDNNELQADTKYKNKPVEVTGNISEVGEMLGSITISLEGESFSNVLCFFPQNQKSSLENLNKGDEITIIGKCEGYSLVVEVKECKLK